MRTGSAALAVLLGLAACASPPAIPSRPIVPLDHLPALSGDYFPILSKATGTRYHIYIRYPEGYARAGRQNYPIIYLLDGDSLFPYLAAHHLFLTIDDDVPEAIVVGIAYGSFAEPVNRRGRDFGEGSAAFHSFLKQELIPAVEGRARADPERRILVGQSRSGGFVLYSAYSDPDLFWGRIASNPSFPTHRKLVLNAPPKAVRTDLRLALSSGTRDRAPIRAATLEWFEAHSRKPGPWRLGRIELEDGTHAADMPNAYRRAVNWLFASQ
jgi:hypothetical protein